MFGQEMAELVANVRTGRRESVSELYGLVRRCAGRLFAAVSTTECEDRIHDTFLIVEHAIREGKVRNPASIAGMIKVILHRQVCWAIKQRVRARKNIPIEEAVELRTHDDLTHQVLRGQRLAVIQQALRRLSDQDREILVRFYLNGEEPKSICSALQLTASQFTLRKSKAKAILVRESRRYIGGRSLRKLVSQRVSAPMPEQSTQP